MGIPDAQVRKGSVTVCRGFVTMTGLFRPVNSKKTKEPLREL